MSDGDRCFYELKYKEGNAPCGDARNAHAYHGHDFTGPASDAALRALPAELRRIGNEPASDPLGDRIGYEHSAELLEAALNAPAEAVCDILSTPCKPRVVDENWCVHGGKFEAAANTLLESEEAK